MADITLLPPRGQEKLERYAGLTLFLTHTFSHSVHLIHTVDNDLQLGEGWHAWNPVSIGRYQQLVLLAYKVRGPRPLQKSRIFVRDALWP